MKVPDFDFSFGDLGKKFSAVGPDLKEWSKVQRFWLEAAGVTLLTLLTLLMVGVLAYRNAGAWNDEALELREIESALRGLNESFVPADSVEQTEWLRSAALLAGISEVTPAPLATASLIAERAEEAGIYTARVGLISSDTLDSPPGVALGSWSASPQETTILVQFEENLVATSRFVGVLPPHVEIASMLLRPDGDRYHSEIRLVSRTIEGPE